MLFNTQQTLKQIVTIASKELENADLFFGHGTDNAWDEACWLVEAIIQRASNQEIDPGMLLEEAILEQIQVLLSRRIEEKIPLAYLLNEAWFAGLSFYVNDRVIIPRSPIAELIKKQFGSLIKKEPETILDLCCGSGCIGLATVLEFPEAKLVLSDLSPEALAVAAINIDKYHLNNCSILIQSDLFTEIEGQFDLIVCNPPYVGDKEYRQLPKEYKHEPVMALITEHNGLKIPVEILRHAAQFLNEEGILILEVGKSWQTLVDVYPKAPFLWLEFENGGEGILALTKNQLNEFKF